MKNFKSILIVVFLMVILSSCNTTKTVSSTPWHDPDMKIIKKSSEKLYLPFYKRQKKSNRQQKQTTENNKEDYLPFYNPLFLNYDLLADKNAARLELSGRLDSKKLKNWILYY